MDPIPKPKGLDSKDLGLVPEKSSWLPEKKRAEITPRISGEKLFGLNIKEFAGRMSRVSEEFYARFYGLPEDPKEREKALEELLQWREESWRKLYSELDTIVAEQKRQLQTCTKAIRDVKASLKSGESGVSA